MHLFLPVVAQLLAQASPESPPAPQLVLVELRNGSEIEGTLLEEEASSWVLGVRGGELRLSKRTVTRVVPRERKDPAAAPPARAAGGGKTRVWIPPPAPMSFEVPESWTGRRVEGRDLAFTDPTQSLFFGVTTVTDPHSLWSFTRSIKRDYTSLYEGFTVAREKLSAAGSLLSWELEFRYRKGSEDFREAQLMLDFGTTKRIFAFTAGAAKFDALVSRFRSLVASFQILECQPPDCEGGVNLFY